VGPADGPGARPSTGSGARGAVLLALALVLGIVLLQEFDTGSVPFSQPVETDAGPTTTDLDPSVSVLPPTTSRALRPADQVKVLPANGTNTSGLGGRTGTLLQNNGYNALAPIDASRTLDSSLVLHMPDFEPEARAIAQLLGLPASSVRLLDDSAPVPETRSADVVVIAGTDLNLPGDSTSTTRRA
jgi:hypothetical protein